MKIKKFKDINESIGRSTRKYTDDEIIDDEILDNDELMKTHLDDESFEYYKEIKSNINSNIKRSLFGMIYDLENYTQNAEGSIELKGDIESKNQGDYTYEIKITRVG